MLRHQFTLELKRAEAVSPILERIALVIEVLDAERLIATLDRERGPQGRGDTPPGRSTSTATKTSRANRGNRW
jgi:hypothetical protein